MTRPTFPDGKRVCCIAANDAAPLTIDTDYTVEFTVIDEDGEWVSLCGVDGEWHPDRFEAVG